MTTNGKEVWENRIHFSEYINSNCQSMHSVQTDPLVMGRRLHWCGKCDHYFIPYYFDKKYRREDTSVLCRDRFSRTISEFRKPSQRNEYILRVQVPSLFTSKLPLASHDRGGISENLFETPPTHPSTNNKVHSKYTVQERRFFLVPTTENGIGVCNTDPIRSTQWEVATLDLRQV